MLKTIVISLLLSSWPSGENPHINYINENKSSVDAWAENFVKETNVVEDIEICLQKTVLPEWSSWRRVVRGLLKHSKCQDEIKLNDLKKWSRDIQRAVSY